MINKKILVNSALSIMAFSAFATQTQDDKYLYIVNAQSSSVLVCTLLDDGDIDTDTCEDAGGGVLNQDFYLQGIVLNDPKNMAYLTMENEEQPYLFECPINPIDGTFYPCSLVEINSPEYYSPYYGLITLNSKNSIVYFPDSNVTQNYKYGRLLACPINDGLISASECKDTGATNLSPYSSGIVLNESNTQVYIASAYGSLDTNGVVICDVNNFQTKSCVTVNDGFIDEMPFTLNNPQALALFNEILYIADNSRIYGCKQSIDDALNFSECFNAYDLYAAGLAFFEDGETPKVYITDYFNTLTLCKVNQDGEFDNCSTPLTDLQWPVSLAVSN